MGNTRRFASALVIALALLGGSVYSQDSTFTITSYIPTHFTQWRWYLDGDGGGGWLFAESHDDYLESKSHSRRENFRGSLSSIISKTYYTPDRFGSWRFDISTSHDAAEGNGWRNDGNDGASLRADTNYSTASNHAVAVRYSLSHLQYLTGKFYGGLELSSAYNWSENPGDEETTIETLYNDSETYGRYASYHKSVQSRTSHEASLSLGPTVGIGRVYDAGYASTAYEMISALRRENLLMREPSYAEMIALSDTIHLYRRTTPIDSRDNRIAALTAIGRFLESVGVMQIDPYRAALLLEDIWVYFPFGETMTGCGYTTGNRRQFGWRAQVGVYYQWARSSYSSSSSSYQRNSWIDTVEYEEVAEYVRSRHGTVTRTHVNLKQLLDYYRPLSYRLQLNFTQSFQVNLYDKEIQEYDLLDYGDDPRESHIRHVDDNYSRTFLFSTSAHLAYWYDNRNQFEMGLAMQEAVTRRDVSDLIGTVTYGTVYLVTAMKYTFRLSVPTSLAASLKADWDWYVPDEDELRLNRSVTFSLGIRHYLL